MAICHFLILDKYKNGKQAIDTYLTLNARVIKKTNK